MNAVMSGSCLTTGMRTSKTTLSPPHSLQKLKRRDGSQTAQFQVSNTKSPRYHFVPNQKGIVVFFFFPFLKRSIRKNLKVSEGLIFILKILKQCVLHNCFRLTNFNEEYPFLLTEIQTYWNFTFKNIFRVSITKFYSLNSKHQTLNGHSRDSAVFSHAAAPNLERMGVQ